MTMEEDIYYEFKTHMVTWSWLSALADQGPEGTVGVGLLLCGSAGDGLTTNNLLIL